jgi:hypothetical protein
MSRARILKPGFFENDQLGVMPMAARLLFAGLWTIADREGRLEDRPMRIKLATLPYDDIDINPVLDSLAEKGFIHRYETDGIKCIEVANFSKHQRPHNNESASSLPPRKEGLSTMVESTSALNRNLVPRTNNLDSSPEIAPDSDDESPSQTKAERTTDYQDFEDRFYSPYPKHVGKEPAFKFWNRLKPKEKDAAAEALQRQIEAAAFALDVQFVPHPASWLNGKRWLDEVVPQTLKTAKPAPKTDADKAREKLAYLDDPNGWEHHDRQRYKGDAGLDMLNRDRTTCQAILAGEAA